MIIRKQSIRLACVLLMIGFSAHTRAFSSEVDTGSREENATTHKAPFRSNRSGKGSDAGEHIQYASLKGTTHAPTGWSEFCAENPEDCQSRATQPRDIIMTEIAWKDLNRVNQWVNETVKPMTDMDHWGVIEKWSYPTDGYGDCEDYVLLKRKILIDGGWPREALLITIVRDKKGDGHAVLTVKSDKGEFILDNQNENILAWTDTGYRFVKRQMQNNPNIWVSLGDMQPAVATATAR